MIRHARRMHGPWCIVRVRAPFGIQIIYQSRSKAIATRWRARHRKSFHGITLFLLARQEVDQKNSDALAHETYWKIIDNISSATKYEEAVIIDVEAWTPSYGTPQINPETVALSLSPARYMKDQSDSLDTYIDSIILRMQENVDSLRVVRRRVEME